MVCSRTVGERLPQIVMSIDTSPVLKLMRLRLGWAQRSWGAPELRAAAIEEFLDLAADHRSDVEQLQAHELRGLQVHVSNGGHTLSPALVDRTVDFLRHTRCKQTELASTSDWL